MMIREELPSSGEKQQKKEWKIFILSQIDNDEYEAEEDTEIRRWWTIFFINFSFFTPAVGCMLAYLFDDSSSPPAWARFLLEKYLSMRW